MALQLVLNVLMVNPPLLFLISLSLSTLLFLFSLPLSFFVHLSLSFPLSSFSLSFIISLSLFLYTLFPLSFLLLPYFLLLSLHSKGLLVLKELGFEVETYIASEIDPDAVKVTRLLLSASIPDYTYSYLRHSIC